MGEQFVNTRWLSNMAFEADVDGHKIVIDAELHVGGEKRGPRPKPFMLAALGGCTAMEITSEIKVTES